MRRITGSALLAVCALALGSATGRGEDKKVNIEGTYVIVGLELGGKDVSEFVTKGKEEERTLKITADQIITTKGGKEEPATYKIDTSKTPYQINLTAKGGAKKDKEEKMYGIVKVDGDKLLLCLTQSEKPEDRPKEFKTTESSMTMLMTLQKKKK